MCERETPVGGPSHGPRGDLAAARALPLTGARFAGCRSTLGATPARAGTALKKNIFLFLTFENKERYNHTNAQLKTQGDLLVPAAQVGSRTVRPPGSHPPAAPQPHGLWAPRASRSFPSGDVPVSSWTLGASPSVCRPKTRTSRPPAHTAAARAMWRAAPESAGRPVHSEPPGVSPWTWVLDAQSSFSCFFFSRVSLALFFLSCFFFSASRLSL